jgi:hypothetical protein
MRQQRKNKIDVRDGDEGILSLLLWMYGIHNYFARTDIIAFGSWSTHATLLRWCEMRHLCRDIACRLPAEFLGGETALSCVCYDKTCSNLCAPGKARLQRWLEGKYIMAKVASSIVS